MPWAGAPADQVAGQAEGGADRDAAAPAQLGQGEPTPAGVERRQQGQRAVDHGLALRRALAPDARVVIICHWPEW
jgi:hypothetical protein